MADQTGPKGKTTADARLDALKAHQAAVAATPEPEDESLVKALLPLVLAQGLDLGSTEFALSGGPVPVGYVPGGLLALQSREGNPLPGMQSTAGRVGWGALETALMGLLLKKAPAVGRPVRNALVGVHTGLARGNMHAHEADDEQRRRWQAMNGNEEK